MMLNLILTLCAALILMLTGTAARADSREANRNAERVASSASIGQPAPDFMATDSKGVSHKLSDLKGKIVVLEWTNPQCPYVRKFYDAHAMQKLQKDAAAKGVVWFTVASSAKGREGFQENDAANRQIERDGSVEAARLMDPTGTMGHLYGATSTPHIFVIDAQGVLAYNGAVDDQPSTNPSSLDGAKNYVAAAIDDLSAGKKVETPSSKPYGCSVKY